jgi:uncharacterized protein GlcG (DUF336 family)
MAQNPYGAPISLEEAKKPAAAALAEAVKNNWTMAVAIVDPSGNLVYYEKMDNTQLGSAALAIGKARSATLWKRSTMAMQESLADGGSALKVFRLQGAVPVAGGFPLIADGKIIGAIGVSGDSATNDNQAATVGAAVVK